MLGKLVAVWHGIVWYLREISGEARYDHYLEHFAAEHPGVTVDTKIVDGPTVDSIVEERGRIHSRPRGIRPSPPQYQLLLLTGRNSITTP